MNDRCRNIAVPVFWLVYLFCDHVYKSGDEFRKRYGHCAVASSSTQLMALARVVPFIVT